MTDEDRGHDFHAQLFTLLPAAAHDDDADHHRAVGAALRVAIDDADPRRAAHDYNVWAQGHGYALVHFLGTGPEGQLHADIQEAVIAIDRAGHVSILESRLI